MVSRLFSFVIVCYSISWLYSLTYIYVFSSFCSSDLHHLSWSCWYRIRKLQDATELRASHRIRKRWVHVRLLQTLLPDHNAGCLHYVLCSRGISSETNRQRCWRRVWRANQYQQITCQLNCSLQVLLVHPVFNQSVYCLWIVLPFRKLKVSVTECCAWGVT